MQLATAVVCDPRVRRLLLLSSCLCLGVARAATTTFHEANRNDLPSWLRQSNQEHLQTSRLLRKPVVLPEDSHEGQGPFNLDGLASLQDERPFTRTDRSLLPKYRHLCETVTQKVELGSDAKYEYQPPHYYEVFCKSYSSIESKTHKTESLAKQKCAHPSFHCIQRSRTLFALRRRWDSDCWEPTTKVIASGCDCMWPTSNLGDVSVHY